MNYEETVKWMFEQLPMYQTQGASAYRKDLTNTILLAKYLGNPEKNLKCIHVAGTNGKGSTSHLLASILQESGYKVGLFTSPHLKDFRERIKVNGVEISKEFVTSFIAQHQAFFTSHNLSFFEMTVGLAFEYFKQIQIDIAIIEVGMGGRLDSTNIITPLVSVITNIGYDHMQFLGTTLESIATEKAGIIKKKIPVVIGQYTAETRAVFEKKAAENEALLFFASDEITHDYASPLLGNYQSHNKKTALKTISVLQSLKLFQIAEDNIQRGFLNVIQNTGLQGRWQKLQENPVVICDTAHNLDGLKIVIPQIINQEFNQLHIVLGLVNDKKLEEILPLFPKNAIYYFCTPNITRGLSAELLCEKAGTFNLNGKVYASVSAAYEASKKVALRDDFIFVGGSTFVVAEIL
jgi:dihydrofolate synthase/folylpolyglutamate synthase